MDPGSYSNAKLAYSYGFVVPETTIKTMDLWMNCPPNSRNAEWKKQILSSQPLTKNQTYDFNGTLRSGKSHPVTKNEIIGNK
jgi:[ribulose-bisphosphate carboxylase]-lysine N-methyltransferase